MARSNSPRVHVRTHVNEVLRAVKNGVGNLQRIWTSRSTVFETYDDESGRRNARHAPRPAASYAENDAQKLAASIIQLNDAIAGLTILRNQLIDTYREVATETGVTISAVVVYPPTPPDPYHQSVLTSR